MQISEASMGKLQWYQVNENLRRSAQMNSKKTIKSAFESMMFIWGQPLDVKSCADIFNISKEDALAYFLELQEEYEQEGRGIVIRQVGKIFFSL